MKLPLRKAEGDSLAKEVHLVDEDDHCSKVSHPLEAGRIPKSGVQESLLPP